MKEKELAGALGDAKGSPPKGSESKPPPAVEEGGGADEPPPKSNRSDAPLAWGTWRPVCRLVEVESGSAVGRHTTLNKMDEIIRVSE
jgi:hypothetical protein